MTWRPPGLATKQIALLWGGVAVSTIALRPVLLPLAVLLPGCALHAWTGYPCPTCGATRAALSLANGHPVAALGANPLLAAGGIAFLLGGIATPIWTLLGGPIPVLPQPLPISWRVGIVVAIAMNWAYLVLAGT